MKKRLSPVYTLRGFRRSLASIDALPQFAILGIFSGLVTGLVILAFRTAIELPLSLLLPDGDFENFEGLSTLSHLMLPALGALSIGIAFSLLKSDRQQVGVSHVLQRLSRHQGYLPTGNLLVQFVGGTLALLTGQSSGREGPAVHLGAASSSLLGQALKLPNNSIRILVGCGAAAAISASFNTPLAGVIFSMEVVVMEYSIAGFVPVILAAISATLVNQVVYGRLAAFDIPALSMRTFFDIPYVVLEGFLIGALAAAFIACVRFFHRYAPTQAWQRLTLAGLITGLMAMGFLRSWESATTRSTMRWWENSASLSS
jgi:CIC family chloride channel protein